MNGIYKLSLRKKINFFCSLPDITNIALAKKGLITFLPLVIIEQKYFK